MRQLSRSTGLMFIFDMLVLALSTFYIANIMHNFLFSIISAILVTISGLFSLFLKGQYKIREFNNTIKNFYLLLEGVIFAHIPIAILLFFFIPKLVLMKFLAVNIFIIFTTLKIYRNLFHYYLFNIKKVKNILVLGTDIRAKVLLDEIQNKQALRMKVVGFVQIDKNNEEIISDSNLPIFIQPNGLKHIIKELDIDIVVIAQPTELILDIPRGIKLYKMPDFYEMATGKYYIDEKTITELYYIFMKRKSYIYDFCKRIYDIVAALIILIVTFPITSYIAIRVWLTDKGNPFFTQTRVGKGGKTFECYKLRTMYVNDFVPKNAEDIKYAESVKTDDRIIPFCKFVRKARFDEIPQMINILKGEMSIVGPRAEWIDEVKIFCEKIDFYSCRMWIKTGWTGWSHINMNPVFSVEEEKERLAYDLYYIKHRNVFWEIGILIKAVFLALGGRHK